MTQEYPINLRFSLNQVKGNMDTDGNDADVISCVEFNDTGEFLATGDRGGRIVIFQKDPATKFPSSSKYSVYCTFTSHDPEFDYLKSLEIEEKINRIKWLPQTNRARFLLSTNDKTIKLWRTTERSKRPTNFNISDPCMGKVQDRIRDVEIEEPMNQGIRSIHSIDEIRVPRFEPSPVTVDACARKVFANAHAYHINSLSVNSDQETFLSADDLRINLWNLEITDQSFNIVDIKPANMEDLVEVITAAEFHPTSCSLFVYSSSKGTIRLCDMRERALCDKPVALFEEPEDPVNRSFFSEIINSISDLNFSHSGRYILSRDYLNAKIWDLRMPREPVEVYQVHEYFRRKLCLLYENDSIFDKFECKWSQDDRHILTGSYNYYFRVFDRETKNSVLLESSRDVLKQQISQLQPKHVVSDSLLPLNGQSMEDIEIEDMDAVPRRGQDEINIESMDLNHKLLHLAWHPQEPILALAGTSNLYIIEAYETHPTANDPADVNPSGDQMRNMDTDEI
ncbi:Serine/threonine-protein phosphatase 2A 55 kDa regulatory subunit B beta isoform [Cichlidogyrus casuarinus]|uniref:Serine/threonine-protein phosphatase 2A 55 kDa regulatory subunit B n=1 Tax=Cichlidogyrus casuarinus TaxID=1844966 RepID=A0ABD2QHP8_9PLAT